MTTIIPFLPSNLKVPTFLATFDGDTYTVRVTWNISAYRYYINIYGADGSWIITVPLITTAPGRQINSVVYDPLQLLLTFQLPDPADWPLPLSPAGTNTKPGTIVDYTISGFQPNTYNGSFRCLQINPTTFSTPMANDPGPVVVYGVVDRLLNMISSVFQTSTLVYRNGAFEINP
jgi:hypothetical protein